MYDFNFLKGHMCMALQKGRKEVAAFWCLRKILPLRRLELMHNCFGIGKKNEKKAPESGTTSSSVVPSNKQI